MSDQRSINTLSASYKGVGFRIRSEAQDEFGRKLVFHEYPNSSSRFIEDLGEVPPRFTVTAFTHGEFWREESDELDRILSESGPGILVLPTFGTYSNVYAMPLSKKASQTSVGEIEYELSFAIGRPIAGPTRTPVIVPDINDKGDIFRDLARIDMSQLWVIASDAVSLISSAQDLETLTRNALKTLANYIDTGALAKVLRIVARIENNPGNLINSGAQVAGALFNTDDALTGFWQQIALSLPNGDGFEAAVSLTNSGTGTELISEGTPGSDSSNDIIYNPSIPLWPEDTEQRRIRNRNRLTLVNSFRIGALSVAYQQAALREYETASQVQAVRSSLEEAYERITTISLKDSNSMQAQQNNKNALLTLRNATLEILEQKEQNASTITDLLNLANYSAYNLTYQLYAEEFNNQDELLTQALIIRNLNDEKKSASDLIGTVTVLKS